MDHQKSTLSYSDSFTDERRLKSDDDSSTSTEETVNNKSVKVTHFTFENIRFTPKCIEFVNAFDGRQYSEKIRIQNVGKNPVLVKIGEPNSFIFQLKKPCPRARFLPAGATIVKTITYTYHSDDLVQKSQLPIVVNGFLLYYPIIVREAKPEIEISPQKLNFEIINLGASAKMMMLTIRNTGDKRTKFEIDCGNQMDLMVNPMRGTVRPKQSINVRVEIMGFHEGEYYRELWIKTTEVPIRVPLLVEVVSPRLEIVYPSGTENFTLINFKPTFKGTQRVESFILRNISNETTLFILLAEVDGKLLDIKQAKNLTDTFHMFQVTTEEGLLAPFETRFFTAVFRPHSKPIEKGWHHQECRKKNSRTKTQCDHVVYFCIQTVYYIQGEHSAPEEKDYSEEHSSTGFLGPMMEEARPLAHADLSFPDQVPQYLLEKDNESKLRFCLHGLAIDPDIIVQPSSFEFGHLNLGQTENRVLKITNNSIVGIRCKLLKVMNIKTKPESVWLERDKAREFLISLTPKCAGIFKTKMKVQVLAESEDLDRNKSLVEIATYIVTVSYVAHDVPSVPTPKVGLGITPLVVDEVGTNKEFLTFKSVEKLPRATVLGLKTGFKPDWMKKEKDQLKNVDNALVAVPNDRARLYQVWEKDKVCRTIFKGFFRYAPPEDLAYTLSTEGRLEKKPRSIIWSDRISKMVQKETDSDFEGMKFLEKCTRTNEGECRVTLPVTKTPEVDEFQLVEDILRSRSLLFMPLSPVFLYRVKVRPKLMNFRMVPISSVTRETITIKNMNSFPISIRFIPGSPCLWMLEEDWKTVPPFSTKFVYVCLEIKKYGRYFGLLNYVINGAHEFRINISAFVTAKTLIVDLQCLEFENWPKDAFQHKSIFLPLENILPAQVKYKLTLLEDTAFEAEVAEGVVPPKSTILTEVSLKLAPGLSFFSELSVISESRHTELIKVSCPYRKIFVDFGTNLIDMSDIPLNLATEVNSPIVNNCYHDVSFQVITTEPMPGVTIVPKLGIIRARSIFNLTIVVKVPVVMSFSFDVTLRVHFSHHISLTVKGNVVCPIIRIRPTEVDLRKICEQSFDLTSICAFNEGTTEALLKVDFTSCPEFTVVDDEDEFTLHPGQSKKVTFRFDPVNMTRYVFYLPLIINRILGPPIIQEAQTEFVSYYLSTYECEYSDFGVINQSKSTRMPCIAISCNVIQPLIHVIPLRLDFQGEHPQPRHVEIKNCCDEEIRFCISLDDLGDPSDRPFKVVPVETKNVVAKTKYIKGLIKLGDSLHLEVTFEPSKFGDFSAKIPVYVRKDGQGPPYNILRLFGNLKAPRITPMSTEVYFPALPLGVASSVILRVKAENYDTFDKIKCLVLDSREESCDNIPEMLTTKWLNEPTITEPGKVHTFELLITFQSKVVVALRSYIILIDSMGGYATILVSAMADNSTVTAHIFLNKCTSRYKLVRGPTRSKEEVKEETKSEMKISRSTHAKASNKSVTTDISISLSTVTSVPAVEMLENGPSLVVSPTKSMMSIGDLGFVRVLKSGEIIEPSAAEHDSDVANSSWSETSSSSSTDPPPPPPTDRPPSVLSNEDLSFPDFPQEKNIYWKYHIELLHSVEKWIFEVVMRCDYYFVIPRDFQNVTTTMHRSNPGREVKRMRRRDFSSFLQQILGTKENLPLKPINNGKKSSHVQRAIAIRAYFQEILRLLHSNGCLLPHIRAENLMEYKVYKEYMKFIDCSEVFPGETTYSKRTSLRPKVTASVGGQSNRSRNEREFMDKNSSVWSISQHFVNNVDVDLEKRKDSEEPPVEAYNSEQKCDSTRALLTKKVFVHKIELLDKDTFELRSTQAWLDIVIQVFRVFVLSKVGFKNTIPQMKIHEMSDKKITETGNASSIRNYFENVKAVPLSSFDSLRNNVYSAPEQILLAWLNYHVQLHVQKEGLWQGESKCWIKKKIINNFDTDLTDSIGFISLTASHCPYIVPYYFMDIFATPDTPNARLHNAGRLVQAWRELQLGLSVETYNILRPNAPFMLMLLTHLYETLPLAYPSSCIVFSAPLHSELTRTIYLKNESKQRFIYEPKFFGEGKEFFFLKNPNQIEVKPSKTVAVSVIYSVRKIRKVSATLCLCGCTSSPNFAKHMVFNLEGEPSELTEYEKMTFSAPLYKVFCMDVVVKSPYHDTATYEIWYTTKKPEYKGSPDIQAQPWSSIWKAKVARRLFLNESELTIQHEDDGVTLPVTVACLTNKKRYFWLLFRSDIGDFIVLIEIVAKTMEPLPLVTAFYSDSWSSSAACICSCSSTWKMDLNCPFVVILRIPARNSALWDALKKMYFKTLNPQDIPFWNKHFELDIGLCLVLWLLNPNEEEEILEEFVEVLPTKSNYSLEVEQGVHDYVILPQQIEVPDVREKTDLEVPIHVSSNAPSRLEFKLTMTSENGKEIRTMKVRISSKSQQF